MRNLRMCPYSQVFRPQWHLQTARGDSTEPGHSQGQGLSRPPLTSWGPPENMNLLWPPGPSPSLPLPSRNFEVSLFQNQRLHFQNVNSKQKQVVCVWLCLCACACASERKREDAWSRSVIFSNCNSGDVRRRKGQWIFDEPAAQGAVDCLGSTATHTLPSLLSTAVKCCHFTSILCIRWTKKNAKDK